MATATTHDVFGQMLTTKEVATICGVTVSLVHQRLKKGMTIEEIIQAPLVTRKPVQVGDVFGLLTVTSIGPPHEKYNGQRRWYCSCACGTKDHLVRQSSLKSKISNSCGCMVRIKASSRSNVAAKDWANVVLNSGTRVVGRAAPRRFHGGNTVGFWLCECTCGTSFEAGAYRLTSKLDLYCSRSCPRRPRAIHRNSR